MANRVEEKIDLDSKIALLKKQAFFAKLTDEELGVLAILLKEEDFSAGDIIVREGDEVDNIYLIVNGTVDVRCFTQINLPTETKSVATLGPGDAIGLKETGLFSLSGKRTATVIALTDALLLRLSVAVLHGFELSNSHAKKVLDSNASSILDDNSKL